MLTRILKTLVPALPAVLFSAACLGLAGCGQSDPVDDEPVEVDHGPEGPADPNANSAQVEENMKKYGS